MCRFIRIFRKRNVLIQRQNVFIIKFHILTWYYVVHVWASSVSALRFGVPTLCGPSIARNMRGFAGVHLPRGSGAEPADGDGSLQEGGGRGVAHLESRQPGQSGLGAVGRGWNSWSRNACRLEL